MSCMSPQHAENPFLTEIMAFRSMVEGLDAPLGTFPESYHAVIAKLVHGRYSQQFLDTPHIGDFVHLL
jgi:hypothetical protein